MVLKEKNSCGQTYRELEMSTCNLLPTSTPSHVPTKHAAESEPRTPIAPLSQDSSGETQHPSDAPFPRRLEGQLTQARFEQAPVRHKRENSSNKSEPPTEDGRINLAFPQSADARKADVELQKILTYGLISGETKDDPVPQNASIKPFIDAFINAAREPQVQAWFEAKGLDVSTVRVFSDGVEGTVLVNGKKVTQKFTGIDTSGWNEVGAKLTEAANRLSPQSRGVLLPDKVTQRLHDLDAVFNFYGVRLPREESEQSLLGQLLHTAGWPALTDEQYFSWRQQFGQLQQKISDIDSRSSLASQLQTLIENAPEGGTLNLGDQLATVRPESTLAQKSQVLRERFAEWLAMPAFKTFIEKLGYGDADQVYRVFDGVLEVRQPDNKWFPISVFLEDEINKVGVGGSPAEKLANSALESQFKQLVEQSRSVGNTLYSQPMYDARQLLAFYGLGNPDALAQVTAAIGALTNNLPPSPARWTLSTPLPENPDRASTDTVLGNALVRGLKSGYGSLIAPQGTSLSRAYDVYQEILAQPELQAWIKSKGLKPEGLILHKDSISGIVDRNGVREEVTFTTADDSGWWQVSAKLRMIMDLLDPEDKGMQYVSEGELWVDTSVVLQAYGLPKLTYAKDQQLLIEQLETTGLTMPAEKYQRITSGLAAIRQNIGDLDERAYLANYLESQVKDLPEDTTMDWSGHQVQPSVSSPLVVGDDADREKLRRFTESPALTTVLEKTGSFWPGRPFRVSEGKFEHQTPEGNWLDLTKHVSEVASLNVELGQLITLSQERGNALYSVPTYDVRQLLDYKGVGSPRTVGETRNVVRWLRTALPPAPALGNYAGLLEEPWVPGKLTSGDKVTLKAEADMRWAGAQPERSEYLENATQEALEQNPAEHLENYLNSTDALDYGQELARILKWKDSPTPKVVSQQLVTAALTLYAEQGKPAKPGYVAGYSLYQHSNMGRTFNAVRGDLVNHLVANRGLEPKLAVLTAQILLAEAAPEFLVKEVPEEILIGTPAWMELRLGCEMANLKAPGTSQMMNEEQISDLTTLAPTSEGQTSLMQLGSIKFLLDWAVLNDVLPDAEKGEHNAESVKIASEAFFKQRKEINDALNAVSEIPSREALAIRELLKVFPGTTRAQLEGMTVLIADPDARRNMSISEPRIRSLIQAYMTGDLTPGKWVLRSDMPQNLIRPRTSPFQRNLEVEAPADKRAELDERIRQLPDMETELKKAVEAHTATLKKAYSTQLKLMFANLPLADRELLNNPESVVSLFSVRGETGLSPVDQTSADVQAARGRQGTLMRVELGTQVCYFEVFANGKIIKRTDLPKQLKLGDVLAGRPNTDYWNNRYQRFASGGFSVKLDLDAYKNGTPPRPDASSRVIIERIGEPIGGTTATVSSGLNTGLTNTFASAKTESIVTLIAEHNLYESDEALLQRAQGTLPLEEKRKDLARDKAILKGLVPFLGAYQEFSNGNVGAGLVALAVDIGGVLLGAGGQVRSLLRAGKALLPNPVSGVVRRLGSKVVPLTPKTAWAKPVASFSDRAFNFIRESALTGSAIMNPADGYDQLFKAGLKGLFKLSDLAKNTSRLGKAAAPHLLTIEEKLRAYWLAGGLDPKPKFTTGGVPGTSQGIDVVAAKMNSIWYALNPKTGKADGTPLPDFKETILPSGSVSPT